MASMNHEPQSPTSYTGSSLSSGILPGASSPRSDALSSLSGSYEGVHASARSQRLAMRVQQRLSQRQQLGTNLEQHESSNHRHQQQQYSSHNNKYGDRINRLLKGSTEKQEGIIENISAAEHSDDFESSYDDEDEAYSSHDEDLTHDEDDGSSVVSGSFSGSESYDSDTCSQSTQELLDAPTITRLKDSNNQTLYASMNPNTANSEEKKTDEAHLASANHHNLDQDRILAQRSPHLRQKKDDSTPRAGSSGRMFAFKDDDGTSNPRSIGSSVSADSSYTSASSFDPLDERIPGGAAAKIMFVGPTKLEEADNDDKSTASKNSADSLDPEEVERALAEIGNATEKAKNEYKSVSSPKRNFFVSQLDADEGSEALPDSPDRSSVHGPPSPNRYASSGLFDRNEVLHLSASAAIEALLEFRHHGEGGAASVPNNQVKQTPADVPSKGSPSRSNSAFQMPENGEANESRAFETASALESPLLSTAAEKYLNDFKSNIVDPDKTMAGLLAAIFSPEGFKADLGFTVRRKNACGALQVMTGQSSNRVPIVWTVGVLTALTSVIRDTGDEGVSIAFSEKRHRKEFEAARNRAIACLMNLSMPPQNRIAILHTPGLVKWLIKVINEGHGKPRKGACAILAYLGKTVENRLLLARVPGLIETLSSVLKPLPPRFERQPKLDAIEKKLQDIGSGSDDDDEGSQPESPATQSKRRLKGATPHKSKILSRDSDDTPLSSTNNVPVELKGYDETADEELSSARQSVFALFIHLLKEKDNAFHLGRQCGLISVLSEIAILHDTRAHILAIKILASITRHRLNSKELVFKHKQVVPALIKTTTSPDDEARLYSCYALQNLTQDKSCRQELAVASGLISSLCDRSRKATNADERLAAICAIKNLCDEPANLIPLTNTPDCIATLMHLAHGMEEGITEMMQYRACDALATLSHWLRKIATSGQALESTKAGKPAPTSLFVPSLTTVSFEQWQ